MHEVSVDECLDRWLAAQKLDAFGAPEEAIDAGGGPLSDATTTRIGRRRQR